MAYPIIRTLTRILAGAVVLMVYLLQLNGKYQNGLLGLNDLQPLAQMMLIFIGIGIVVFIAVEIIFHILFSIGLAVKETVKDQDCSDEEIGNRIKNEMVEDEMSKLIELKSMRAGYFTTGFGFIASVILLALGQPVFTIANILFVSFFFANIVEGFARIYYYKKGI
jgi:hypothetical protein